MTTNPKPAPSGASKTIGKGNASKQAARIRSKVDANKARLDEMASDADLLAADSGGSPSAPSTKVRKNGTCTGSGTAVRDDGTCRVCGSKVDSMRIKGSALPAKAIPHRPDGTQVGTTDAPTKKAAPSKAAAPKKAAAKKETAPRKAAAPKLTFLIDGKPVAPVHSSLAGVARASARNKGTRLGTAELRTMIEKAGINPESAGWSFTLPNGVVLSTKAAG